MPKGMLTRFIVEMHRLIDSNLVWKDGVILADRDGDARAEVIESYYKHQIRIRISGSFKKNLRERIRHEFDNIHMLYDSLDKPLGNHRLRYQEFIPCNCSVCKGSQMPHSYALKSLKKRLRDDRQEIECEISYTMVKVRDLIDDAVGRGSSTRSATDSHNIKANKPDTVVTVNIGDSTMTDQSTKGNSFDLSKANVGAIATDSAQATVTNNAFIQNHNADTAELFNLIAALRQAASQFPPDIQENVIIEIEDLETEVQKPDEQRSVPRLKRSLIALFGAASLVAAPVAGMVDFTNTVLELGSKFNIELPQLP